MARKPKVSLAEVEHLLAVKEKGPFTRGWAAWALDMLIFGKTKEAEEFLRRSLRGDEYGKEKPVECSPPEDLEDMLR